MTSLCEDIVGPISLDLHSEIEMLPIFESHESHHLIYYNLECDICATDSCSHKNRKT